MFLYSDKLTRGDLDMIAGKMPVQLFDTWPEFEGERRRKIKLLLRPTPLGTAGDRWRKLNTDQFTGRQRRVFACSWDAHYVFMAACLELDPTAEFKSALAHWKGREDFHHRAPDTGNLNWGSMMYPQYASEMTAEPMSLGDMRALACEIAGTDAPEHEREIRFSTLYEHGGTVTETGVRTIMQSTIAACPHFILVPEHYRPDGVCKCTDRGENIMADWGYTWDEALGRWN